MTAGEGVINILSSLTTTESRFAFLPYKASMFDCMETVYLAARAHGLVADLVPLDYQTLPDEKWHNEAEAFRQMGYDAISFDDFKEQSYDYIIIHYPYDRNNIVTRLTPEECTDRLKQYGQIVYIPYHGNIAGPEWKRFFTTPGCTGSDVVVLGSDNDVKWFREVNPDYSGTIILSKRPLKVEAAKYHEADPMPEEYTVLAHPITLVLGTLHTFTRNPAERIAKHRNTLQKLMQEEGSIIYRPHPLVRDAIAVMQPNYLSQYDAMMSDFRERVIVDESPFLSRAMRAADRMVCDPSSVTRTWEGTGKPCEVME